MTETQLLIAYAIAAGFVGRVLKLIPAVPKSAIPWAVLVAGYALTFGVGLYSGLDAYSAAVQSWTGIAAGMAAVGGHEALKPLAAKVLGPELAAKLLGKLPEPKPAKVSK